MDEVRHGAGKQLVPAVLLMVRAGWAGNQLVPAVYFDELLDQHNQTKYHKYEPTAQGFFFGLMMCQGVSCRYVVGSFVDDNKTLKWCPAPGCKNSIEYSKNQPRDICCDCGHRFCWQCREACHRPVDCRHAITNMP